MLFSAACLWLLVAGGDAGAGPGAPTAAVERAELRPSELRLGEGAFTLKLNTGWLAVRPMFAGDPRFVPGLEGALDLRNGRGRLRLGGGDERRLMFHIEWNVAVEGDMARVQSRIDLAMFGRGLTLTPPDIRVRPRFDAGGGIDVMVPFLEGRF